MDGKSIDINDFIKFAPVAYRLGVRKGYLSSKPLATEKATVAEEISTSLPSSASLSSSSSSVYRLFYSLFGNLLFSFRSEDPSSFVGLLFLESSTIKKTSTGNGLGLSIVTVGGTLVNLYANSSSECSDWIEAIEVNKHITMTRKFEDIESSTIQTYHRVEQQEQSILDLEEKLEVALVNVQSQESMNQSKDHQLKSLEAELSATKSHLKSVENERLMLLQSKGITPRSLPAWASNHRDDKAEMIKIWTGTWNLGASDPFAGMERQRAHRLINPFVTPGYDVYCLGVQECIGDSIFECVQGLLAAEGYFRLNLEREDPSTGLTQDLSKLFGRGDGSIISQKFTGLGIFIHRRFRSDVKLLSVAQVPFTTVHSKGSVAAAISLFGRSMVFVTSHFESDRNDIRRSQYRKVVTALGEKLGESGFNLNELFNHIIWNGDLNYRLVDTSGNALPAETALQMLEDNFQRTLFEVHDHLRQERKSQMVFYGYREPIPFPNFYPTYKKYENRLPVDYSKKSWVRECYRTKYKEPFYKGGGVKERTPGFCDRILYHSMVDLSEDLLPECVPQKLSLHNYKDSKDSTSGGGISSEAIALSGGNDFGLTNEPKLPNAMTATIDNYQSINDGDIFSVSDHSPVFATFLLRLQHDHEALRKDVSERLGEGKGNIRDVLSALEETVAEVIAEDAESQETEVDQRQLVKWDLSYSLLPDGPKKIMIRDIKLIWGASEDFPSYVRIVFPVPYEVKPIPNHRSNSIVLTGDRWRKIR